MDVTVAANTKRSSEPPAARVQESSKVGKPETLEAVIWADWAT
jgi:hypothetical protein